MTTVDQTQLDEIFKALASEHRRAILRMLGASMPEGESSCCGAESVCACDIVALLGVSPSTVSHHMGILRKAGLVEGEKRGLWMHYTLCREPLQEAAGELRDF